MNTADLDKLYSPSQWVVVGDPALAEEKFVEITHEGSVKAVETVPSRLGVSYGDTEAQKVDFFGEDVLPKDAPIFVFLHGGYWISGSREDSRLFVPPLYESGILCCVVGYDLISNSVILPDIVLEVQRAFKFIVEYAEKRGSRGVYVCGHSSGGHLITMALSTETGAVNFKHLIKGVIPISGLFNLTELLPTKYATDARLTEDIAENYSPLTAVECLKKNISPSTPVLVVSAQYDSPAFIRQSEVYFQALKEAGINSTFELIKDEDHFTIIEKLRLPDFILTKMLIEFVKAT